MRINTTLSGIPTPDTAPTAPGFRQMFAQSKLTLGLFFPLAAYANDTPNLEGQAELAAQADQGGFSALWTRDVPLQDPEFGDLGQVIDPLVWMGYMANHVRQATLASGSLILPLRHPIHVAKAAASLDNLTNGRFVMGVASGDRAIEFPAFGQDHATRDHTFREAYSFIEQLLTRSYPLIQSELGTMSGGNLVPKPAYGRVPIGITGSCRQTLEWNAKHADFWLTHPRGLNTAAQVLHQWRSAVQSAGFEYEKPVAQSLYIDLSDDPKRPPAPIHLGYRMGRESLLNLLNAYQEIGINHVAFILKFSQRPVNETLQELAEEVIPLYPAHPV